MSRVCIYTLEPVEYGGVPDKVHFAYDVIKNLGHDSNLIYVATNRVPNGSRFDKIKFFLTAKAQDEIIYNMHGFGIPDYPLPAWLPYLMPLVFARHIINASQMHLAISGSNHVALPSAILNRRFIVWIGTMYEEEIVGKAIGGDPWAVAMMKKPITRKILEWQERFIFRRASLILTNGKHTAEAVARSCPEAANKIRTLIFPIDETRFKPKPSVRDPSHPYLLFAARINEPRKNTPLLIRAFARVHQRHPNLKLILTGDPPNDILLNATREAKVMDSIDFRGYQTPDELIQLYQGAELFIVPSLQEGMCNAMLEALACGTPTIATRCGGPEKMIVDDEIGYLVDNNDEDQLVTAIIKALANPAHLNVMRQNARDYAVNTYARPIAEKILRAALKEVYPQHF
ncbi:MAG: glycosyltransferase family 4 protein [Chloroflexi bacterium]|nr:glycosyltransferase family 4 protein [Chloroflexota bacterium]